LRTKIALPLRQLRRSSIACLVFFVVVAAWSGDEDPGRSELSALLSAEGVAGFSMATDSRIFEFPRDHGPHPEFRNEWWYMTGNLDATDGRRFGFELTFFRFALAPDLPGSDSAWQTNQVYIAHLAVTDTNGQRFFVAERFSRGALGLAGAQDSPFRVWIDDWEIAGSDVDAESENWRLQARDEEIALSLQLVARKLPVLNGANGLSQKSAQVGNASYYYSITRWQTDGRVQLGNDEFTVSGLSWLDREWSSSALASDQQGWDWFALQLSDGSELMFYNLRKTDGSRDFFSSGTWISSDGSSRHISSDKISISVTKTWSSPEGGTYPSSWEIRFPERDLVLKVVPVMDDQELFTTVRYWEGAVDVTGTRDGASISGRGYVELTGYAD